MYVCRNVCMNVCMYINRERRVPCGHKFRGRGMLFSGLGGAGSGGGKGSGWGTVCLHVCKVREFVGFPTRPTPLYIPCDAHTDTTQLIRSARAHTHTHAHAHAQAHLEHEMIPFVLRRHQTMLCLLCLLCLPCLPRQRGRALQNAARVRLLHSSDRCLLWRHVYLRWSIPLRLVGGSVVVVLARVCGGILPPPIALFGSFILSERSSRLLFLRSAIHC
jgi:hypothetical protein